MPFSPNDELTMRFTVAEWNTIIAVLADGTYKTVFPLIQKINMQAAQHNAQATNPQPGVPNGQDQEAQLPQVTPPIVPRGDLN